MAVLLLGGIVAVAHLAASVPPPRLSLTVPSSVVAVPGTPPAVALPAQGSLYLEGDPGARLAAVSAGEVRPIASVAKTMTALVVLRLHPLASGEDGPVLTMTADDVALYQAARDAGGSYVPVREGERLSERQLLLGLLLPSANNFAETLARWAGGTRERFLQRLDATAAELAMKGTHFDDPSGFSPATVSTAADLVRLGRAALAVPALADIVATPSATLPDGTVLHNLDVLVGTEPGWLGIKTGDSDAAGGCLLFAARRPAAGGPPAAEVTVVGAILGQPDLARAIVGARDAAETALAGYATADLAGLAVAARGALSTVWGDGAPVHIGMVMDGAPVALRLGTSLILSSTARPLRAPLSRGGEVAVIVATLQGRIIARWPVLAGADVSGPSLFWRLLHG